MKVYIAGKLWEESDRAKLEKIDKICKELNLDTYLPHRDMGVYTDKDDPKKFFKRDKEEIDICNFMIALIDWQGISSGTAWEIGYAHAKNIPVIGLVEDASSINKEFRTCVMCNNSVIIVDSIEKLKQEIKTQTLKYPPKNSFL
jgi:nucleoside 2-deoxyribosyltransferase